MAKKDVPAEQEKMAVVDYGKDAGVGFEGTTASDLSIPFINILQANSPQVQEEDPPGSKSGYLYNTVTKEIHPGSDGILFLPVYKDGPVWVEWIPRSDGGGFVGIHMPESELVKYAEPIAHPKTGKPTRKLQIGDGHELVETYHAYGLLLDELPTDETAAKGFAVINFTSTKIKPFRDWQTAMYMLKGRPPIFANRARITTAMEKRDGNTYYNFRINPYRKTWAESLINPANEQDLLKSAKEFREMVISGLAHAAYETTTNESGGTDTESDKPPF